MNQNLKLSLTPNEYLVPLKNGMGQIRAVRITAKCASGASLEEA
jgi:hypothetical protein